MGLPPDRNIGPVLIWLTAVLDVVAVSLTGLRLWIRRKHRNLGEYESMDLVKFQESAVPA